MLARRAQYHQNVLISHMTPYDSAYRDALAKATGAMQAAGSMAADAVAQAHGSLYGTLLRQSNMLAFSDAFRIMGMLFLVIVPLMFLLRKTGPARGPAMAE